MQYKWIISTERFQSWQFFKLFLRINPIEMQKYFLLPAYFSEQLRSVLVRSEVPPRQSANSAHKYAQDDIKCRC
jgi:hypothetical protein